MLNRDESGSSFHTLRMPIAARELEAGFVGFRAAVAEERAREARQRRQTTGRVRLERVEIQVRGVEQRPCLFRDHRCQAWMRMTERGHTDPGDEVEILAH